MQLDVFVPFHNLAFEYQGEQHYKDIPMMGPQSLWTNRDQQKRKACFRRGITLIEIPYWWNEEKESLLTTIHKQRSDIFPDFNPAAPIPEDPPKKSNEEAVSLISNSEYVPFWDSLDNQKKFFFDLSEEFSIHNLEDWYKLTTQDIYKHGGRPIMKRHGDSLFIALFYLYPELLHLDHWNSLDKQRNFMEWMAKELKIKHLNEWHSIKEEIFLRKGGQVILSKYSGSLRAALKSLYPKYLWKWKS